MAVKAENVRSGDIEQVILWGRIFDPKKGGKVSLYLSGYENESEGTGNGGIHTNQSIVLGGFDGLPVSLNWLNNDLEFLNEKYKKGEAGECALTLINGITYGGTLVPEGRLSANTGDGEAEVNARGTFEQI